MVAEARDGRLRRRRHGSAFPAAACRRAGAQAAGAGRCLALIQHSMHASACGAIGNLLSAPSSVPRQNSAQGPASSAMQVSAIGCGYSTQSQPQRCWISPRCRRTRACTVCMHSLTMAAHMRCWPYTATAMSRRASCVIMFSRPQQTQAKRVCTLTQADKQCQCAAAETNATPLE